MLSDDAKLAELVTSTTQRAFERALERFLRSYYSSPGTSQALLVTDTLSLVPKKKFTLVQHERS